MPCQDRVMTSPDDGSPDDGSTDDGRVIEANGISLYVEDHGDGVPVLLLHGWPDSARLWRHQVPALTAGGYRVITPDMRGFGRSERPAEVRSYGLRNVVGDVRALLDRSEEHTSELQSQFHL